MLKVLIPLLFLGIGAVGGGTLAVLTGFGASENMTAESAGESTEDQEPPAGPTDFAALKNQFIVPIIHDGRVASMVVMSITVEVPTGGTEVVFDREPRLRDAFLQVLFDHAALGGFDGVFTSGRQMTPLRQGLREAARLTLGKHAVHDVLITEIARQEV